MPIKILVTILILNAATFTLYSIWSKAIGAPDLILISRSFSKQNPRTVSYVISGNLNQADNVSHQLAKALPAGDVIAANFHYSGYNPEKFVTTIKSEIAALPKGTEVLLFSLSLGVQPSQTIANDLDLPLYAINPCANSTFLQPGYKAACYAAYIIGTPLKYTLGWLSHIPIIGQISGQPDHRNYSIATLIEQYRAIIRYSTRQPSNITSVIISSKDQILDNSRIEEWFLGCSAVYIDTNHGNTFHYPEEYINGLKEILPSD